MRGRVRTIVGIVVALLLAQRQAATPQTVQYAYDAAGRLSVVADARGDLAVYEYDAVGNLLSIRRLEVGSAPESVVVALIAPGAARRGATISIFGKGFASTPAANVVTFNGARAGVVAASATRLTVTVPPEATTGPVGVTTTLGAATAAEWFRVLGELSITPATAVVAPGGRVRFAAVGEGLTAVRWSVDGLAGGDVLRGTITSDGVYVAPPALPPDGARIVATSVDDAAIQATARVSMIAARSLFLVTRAAVSVGLATTPTFAMAAPLALAVAPIVTNVDPSDGGRGETIRLTVTGAGFQGATDLQLLTGAEADPALAVSNLAISPDGGEATADIGIAADAGLGPRIVRIVTPGASSSSGLLGNNVFTVR